MVDNPHEPAKRNASRPPAVPVGLDAYRLWERWPYQRIGVRAYLRSTYDRTGHNHTADASHYLHQDADDFNVTLDVEGAGILYFVRTNRWHGSPWHYEIDGVDHVVAESTTDDPLQPRADAVFVPEDLFPSPLTYTYATTKGADLNWVPMPFGERLRIAYSRTYYGTGYYIYHQWVPGTELSAPLAPWDGATPPDRRVLELLNRAGQDLTPAEIHGLAEYGGMVRLRGGAVTPLVDLGDGPAMLRRLALSAPAERAVDLGRHRLQVTWDDRDTPSVDAPLDLFFGAGTLHNGDGREWLVKALPMSIRFVDGRVHLACSFPMPYFRSARIALVGTETMAPVEDVRWAVTTVPFDDPWNHVGYFHATHHDHGEPAFGLDLTFLDTRGAEGAAEWSGSFVGTSFSFTDRNVLTTLEGDPRFFFDDSQTPQAQGTGTEEWGGGGDYWGGRTMTLPLAGHPVGVVDAAAARCPEDLVHSAYRFLLADLMPFGRRALIRFEHGGENESAEHYESVSYWYGLPSPSLVLTDSFEVGDADSEAAHHYSSPDASPPYVIRSRYEWGPDHLPAALGQPLATPDDHVDFDFHAPEGAYRLWIETRVADRLFDASVWPQLNDQIGTRVLYPASMGSMGYQNAGRPPGSYRFNSGEPGGSTVTLSASGPQRLRIQPRHGQMRITRILLSPTRRRRPPADVDVAEQEVLLTPDDVAAHGGTYDVVDDREAPGGRAIVLGAAPAQVEIFPEMEKAGRRTEGASEFTLAIRPDNHGVMLRRTLDYRYANQRARVFIEVDGEWMAAGVWYLAGSRTVYHSFPWTEGELAPVRPLVITSNRRFRDDEFLLPVDLTRGRDQLRLRIECAPRNPPLLPNREPEPSAWTELTYRAYSYVMPRVELPE